ncbi:hypothetical protein PMIN03_002961 [Paraphaeosphaeria minitans]|uniref:Amidase n=1 Tax=Paraphaeosphaeria minitans TaxID=565426 RepID=A0A9P6KNG3_9PLEO|nr:amidase [Paraphaeosphaeria minitans]
MLDVQFLLLIALSSAAPVKRNACTFLYPKATFSGDFTSLVAAGSLRSEIPITVINTNVSTVSQDVLTTIVQSYEDGDDVFTADYLETIFISSSAPGATLDPSATSYLESLNISHVFVDARISMARYNTLPVSTVSSPDIDNIPSGPYLALIDGAKVSLASVFLLYPDTYRDFLFGAYDSNDGDSTHNSVGVFHPKMWDPPMAGWRVAIKDLFDIKGLQTSGGSQAWAYITPIANETAPSIQRILDLGGVLRYWIFHETSSGCERHLWPAPLPRSYELGESPSSGWCHDTAGVFSRDPYKWIAFSKAWYEPTLFQPPNITGLSPLEVPDTLAFPQTIIYPTDYLPLNNSAAEVILQNFITNLTTIFNMTVKTLNLSETVQSINATEEAPFINSLIYLTSVPLGVINTWSAWDAIGSVLTSTWAALFDGRFPPIDPARCPGWKSFNTTRYSPSAYANALVAKNAAVEWWETSFQPTTSASCSENIFLYDIGTGGFPSYRELGLNGHPNTSFLAVKPLGAEITGANICPVYGCADFTVPIGQVPYRSHVAFHEEMVPLTVNMVVRRGCDFMLLNMIEKLADHGVLKAVETGKTAF